MSQRAARDLAAMGEQLMNKGVKRYIHAVLWWGCGRERPGSDIAISLEGTSLRRGHAGSRDRGAVSDGLTPPVSGHRRCHRSWPRPWFGTADIDCGGGWQRRVGGA